MKNPLISVIVPVYNAEKYIRKCLDSVTSQSYRNLEIIVINDGSTDSSGAVIDEYVKSESRIKAIHKDNGGVSSARNRGLEVASGDYVTFVDSDDFIENNTYNEVVEVLRKGEKDFVMFSMRVVDEQGKTLAINGGDDSTTLDMSTNGEIVTEYLDTSDLSACNYVINRGLIESHRFDENMRRNEDALFVFEALLRATTGVRIKKVFYNYLHNKQSATKSFRKEDIGDRKKYIYSVIDSTENMHPDLLLRAKARVLRNQDLIGLLLNSKMVHDRDSVVSTRRVMYNYLDDLRGIYSLPKKDRLFVVMTYLPDILFKTAYRLYHTAKEVMR